MPRSFWSGAISFGLVNIPVKLYTAIHDEEIRFHMLHARDGARIRQKLFCAQEGQEVQRDQTVKGFEVGPDRYVTVTEEELEALAPENSRAIEITDFVGLADIDPIYYDRPYYLLPDENALKPYLLLMQAMQDSRKVAIATFVMHGKAYLAAIRPAHGVLVLESMHFAKEVVPAESLGALGESRLADAEVLMARRLVDSMSRKFKPERYRDEYRDRVEEMLKKKAKGEIISAPSPARQPRPAINLMEALKASLAAQGKEFKPPRPTRAKAASRATHKATARDATKHAPRRKKAA